MTLRLAAALTIGALLIAPTAFAQTPSHIPGSGQGGYLGINPGAAAPVVTPPQQLGSMQGGYLGKNPGATLSPPRTPGSIDASSPPTAFCAPEGRTWISLPRLSVYVGFHSTKPWPEV